MLQLRQGPEIEGTGCRPVLAALNALVSRGQALIIRLKRLIMLGELLENISRKDHLFAID